MKTLKNLIALSQNIKIFVPSKIGVDQFFDNEKVVQNTLILLSQIFGGATSYAALATWATVDGNLIKENTTICQSFCTQQQLSDNMEKIYDYCSKMKNELSQYSIPLEVNNVVYLV